MEKAALVSYYRLSRYIMSSDIVRVESERSVSSLGCNAASASYMIRP